MSLTQVTPDVISTNTISGLISLGFNTLNVANLQVQTVDSGTGNTLVFRANTAERMRITSTGSVGIGTDSPASLLNIASNSSAFYADTYGTGNSVLGGRRARGTAAAPTAVQSGDALVSVGGLGYGATGFTTGSRGRMTVRAAENWTDSAQGTYLTLDTTSTGSTTITERMRIDSSGNIGIGTSSPAVIGYTKSLTVSGASGSSVLEIASDRTTASQTIGSLSYVSTGNSTQAKKEVAFIKSIIDGATSGDTGAYLSFATKADAGNITERMRITSDGNVGIGTTAPQATLDLGSGSNGRALTWGGSTGTARYASIFGSYSSAALVLATDFHGSTSADSYITSWTGTAAASGIRLNLSGTTGIQFFTDAAASKTAGDAFTPTERMRIDANGFIGIGTSSPNITGFGSSTSAITIKGSSSNGRGVIELVSNGTSANGNSLGDLYFYDGSSLNGRISVARDTSTSTGYIWFATNGGSGNTERMRITSAGNVGIGTTLPGNAKLRVNQPSGSYDTSYPQQVWAYANYQTVNLYHDGSVNPIFNTDADSYWAPSATMIWQYRGIERMRITSDGNVGIGTSSPSSLMHLSSSVTNSGGTGTEILRVANLRVNTNASGAAIRFVTNEVAGTNQYTRAQITGEYDDSSDNNGRLLFATTNTGGNLIERLRIRSHGTVILQGGSTSATGTGITFPATQNASADANTLDDYEEGTWTPTLGGFSSVTYAYRIGTYIKIGRMVYAFWDFQVNSRTGSSNEQITGLPFTVSADMAGYSVALHRDSGLFNTGVSGGQLKGFVNQNTTYIAIQVDNSGTAGFGFASSAGVNASGRSTGCVMYQSSN